MATQIPLNTFKLVIQTLNAGATTIYQENVKNVSSIVLSAQISNTSNTLQRCSVKLQKGATSVYIMKNAAIPAEEMLNPLAGKIVLEKGSAFIVETDNSGVLDVQLSILENAND